MNNIKLKVKGILLDLDGTVLDTKDAYVAAAKNAFKKLGLCEPKNGIALEIPKRIEQKLPLADLVGCDSSQFLDVYLKGFYNISSNKTRPFPHVIETLAALSQKAKLAIITMRFVPKEIVIKELKQFGLEGHFTQVFTALDTDKPKPSPEALIKAAKAIDVKMDECAIVGDSVIDVQAGKAAQTNTVAVLSGLYSREELAKTNPDLIIKNIKELPKFID
ncbi:MAG: HAD family hydrolase [Candidatus Bathyarchaeota archaeon]|nr:HAD family hydrolase [Candidatus Bathyarchaeota archaeon]